MKREKKNKFNLKENIIMLVIGVVVMLLFFFCPYVLFILAFVVMVLGELTGHKSLPK